MFGIFRDIGSHIVPIFGMAFAAYVIYLSYKEKQEKNKERIALIEKGLDPSLLNPKRNTKQSSLKIGLLLISIAVGVLFGYMINTLLFVPVFVAYSSSILVFCGMLLVYFHKSRKA